MKKLLLIAILFCLGRSALAQKVYFIYIQSEASTPFYVKMGDKVYSSTASGYLILSRLKDSTYSFYLGQPGNQSKELSFSVSLNNTDRGFLLKNLQNEWVLFDLQSMATIKPAANTSGAMMFQTDVIKNDFFTRLLAKAVDDSTLLLEPILAANKEVKQKTEKSKNKPDEITQKLESSNTSVVVNSPAEEKEKLVEETIAAAPVSSGQTTTTQAPTPQSSTTQVSKSQNLDDQTVANQTSSESVTDQVVAIPGNTEQTEYKRSIVKRYAESSNFQGFGLTYLDTWEGVTDTIRLMIPNVVDANYSVSNSSTASLPQSAGNTQSSNDNIEKSTPKTVAVSNNFVADTSATNNNSGALDTTANTPADSPQTCKISASDREYAELRKNMVARARGEEMLAEARKAFNEKCFTTEQIRNLSTLFLTSEGKFLFFKDAKEHISDKDRFETLIFEFKEDIYKDRFKVLLNN